MAGAEGMACPPLPPSPTETLTAKPVPEIPVPDTTVPWSSVLCDCCNDVDNCYMTCCCPAITFGRIAEIIDRGVTSRSTSRALYAAAGESKLAYSWPYRSKMKRQYNLAEEPCNDCLVHCCCEPCSLCQMYRELQSCGFVMEDSWEMNVERMGTVVQFVPPTVEESMIR